MSFRDKENDEGEYHKQARGLHSFRPQQSTSSTHFLLQSQSTTENDSILQRDNSSSLLDCSNSRQLVPPLLDHRAGRCPVLDILTEDINNNNSTSVDQAGRGGSAAHLKRLQSKGKQQPVARGLSSGDEGILADIEQKQQTRQANIRGQTNWPTSLVRKFKLGGFVDSARVEAQSRRISASSISEHEPEADTIIIKSDREEKTRGIEKESTRSLDQAKKQRLWQQSSSTSDYSSYSQQQKHPDDRNCYCSSSRKTNNNNNNNNRKSVLKRVCKIVEDREGNELEEEPNCSSGTLRQQEQQQQQWHISGSKSSPFCLANKMPNKDQSTRLIPAYFIAELVGTFLLVIIGDGAAAAYVLSRHPVDVFCVCFSFGVGAMIATFASARISGAHINPAASLAFALDGQLKWRLVPVYMLAQYLGGFLAALVLFLNYNEAINALDGGQHSGSGADNSTGGVFATYPAPYVTMWGCLLDQIIGTAVLLFSISAVTDRSNRGLDDKHQPLVVAFVIGCICVAFSPNCGAIFNPARDLAPRLLTALFGYSKVWAPIDGTYWLLAGVLGPHLGAILGVFAYKFTIGYALASHKRHTQQQQQQHELSPNEAHPDQQQNHDFVEGKYRHCLSSLARHN